MKEELLVGKNEQPTGSLYLSAKESGFNYVAEILVVKKASKASRLNKVNDTTILPSKLMRKNMLFFYSCSLRNFMWLTCLVKKDLLFNCTNS